MVIAGVRHTTPDTRHRRKSENDFIVFTNAAASAVHWTDNYNKLLG